MKNTPPERLSKQQQKIVEYLSRPESKGKEFTYGDVAEIVLKESRKTHSKGVGSSMRSLESHGYSHLCKMVVKDKDVRKKKHESHPQEAS